MRKKQKTKKLIALTLMCLVLSTLISTSAMAVQNVIIPVGKLKYYIRYEPTGFTVPRSCVPTGRVEGGHVNIVIKKQSSILNNWHIGRYQGCVVAFDTKTRSCPKTCGPEVKIGDLLYSISISNTAIKAIEGSSKALDKFRQIYLGPGKNAIIVYVAAVGVFIVAATPMIVDAIRRIIMCMFAHACGV